MSFIEVLQTQSKEDAQKALFDMLNNKAMGALTEMQIDELSKDTLKSYVKKSGTDIMGKSMKIGHGTAREKDTSDVEDKVNKRLRGVGKAVDKIAEGE